MEDGWYEVAEIHPQEFRNPRAHFDSVRQDRRG